MDDIVRVIRVLEYVGPVGWVEATLRRSFADSQGKVLGGGRAIAELVRTAPEPWPPARIPAEASTNG